jgi:antitoxin ParD1/3/4
MPTRNVNLTPELDSFVLAKVESRRYENASEVIRAALRTLEREEQKYDAKLAALRTAIDAGDASGVAEGNSFDRVRQTLKIPQKRQQAATFRLSRLADAGLLDIGGYGNPVSGRSCEHAGSGLRRMEQGSHVVFFRREPGGILVSRILHQAAGAVAIHPGAYGATGYACIYEFVEFISHHLRLGQRWLFTLSAPNRNVLVNPIAHAPFPHLRSPAQNGGERFRGTRLLRGECEPLTASTVPDTCTTTELTTCPRKV